MSKGEIKCGTDDPPARVVDKHAPEIWVILLHRAVYLHYLARHCTYPLPHLRGTGPRELGTRRQDTAAAVEVHRGEGDKLPGKDRTGNSPAHILDVPQDKQDAYLQEHEGGRLGEPDIEYPQAKVQRFFENVGISDV